MTLFLLRLRLRKTRAFTLDERRSDPTREVACKRLDLDNFRTRITELHRTKWTAQPLGQIENTKSFETSGSDHFEAPAVG